MSGLVEPTVYERVSLVGSDATVKASSASPMSASVVLVASRTSDNAADIPKSLSITIVIGTLTTTPATRETERQCERIPCTESAERCVG